MLAISYISTTIPSITIYTYLYSIHLYHCDPFLLARGPPWHLPKEFLWSDVCYLADQGATPLSLCQVIAATPIQVAELANRELPVRYAKRIRQIEAWGAVVVGWVGSVWVYWLVWLSGWYRYSLTLVLMFSYKKCLCHKMDMY